MKIFNQLAIILGIWILGEFVSGIISNIIVIPGSVLGMIFLFISLQFKIIELKKIEDISEFLLGNMAIFFIPAGVSLIKSIDIIKENFASLTLIILFSTIIVMYVSGKVVELMINKRVKE